MKIQPDKLMHLKLGVPLAALVAVIALTGIHAGPGFAVALGSASLGIGMELNQKLRKDGTVEVLDAVCSAAAGVLAGLVFEAWRAWS